MVVPLLLLLLQMVLRQLATVKRCVEFAVDDIEAVSGEEIREGSMCSILTSVNM